MILSCNVVEMDNLCAFIFVLTPVFLIKVYQYCPTLAVVYDPSTQRVKQLLAADIVFLILTLDWSHPKIGTLYRIPIGLLSLDSRLTSLKLPFGRLETLLEIIVEDMMDVSSEDMPQVVQKIKNGLTIKGYCDLMVYCYHNITRF